MTEKAVSNHPVQEESEILSRVEGRTGIITLNRPKALNALSLPMFRAIDEALAAWEKDDGIDAVVINSSSARAFCAASSG